jgi:cytochrome P450
MKITTQQHAVYDYAAAGLLIALPRIMGSSRRCRRILTAIGLCKLGYTMLTRHEGGVLRAIPMESHLLLDKLSGGGLPLLPKMLGEEDRRKLTAILYALGGAEVTIAMLTDKTSTPRLDEFRIQSPAAACPFHAGKVSGLTENLTSEAAGDHRLANDPQPEGLFRGRAGVHQSGRMPSLSVKDSLQVVSRVILPTVAKGPIIRRPSIVALAERADLDHAAVRTMQALRERYGAGPRLVQNPIRTQVLLFDPQDVQRVLEETPIPFSPASTEKQAALSHFEPYGSLITPGSERTIRRQLSEEVLEHESLVHSYAKDFLSVIDDEADRLLAQADRVGELRWDEFFDSWFCAVRRIVFGDSARNDRRLTDLMSRLRSHGNWVFLKPRRTDLRDELHWRIRQHLRRAEAGSLAAVVGERMHSEEQSPENQIPQWLFAFDPAAMATYRGLALLASHPHMRGDYVDELTDGVAGQQAYRPWLRATILESLRLWPTTPLILRQTTQPTEWSNGWLPANAGVAIFAPFFHRDDRRLPDANAFNPARWLSDREHVEGAPMYNGAIVPFSGGPGHCPGRNLVLMLGTGMLAALLGRREVSIMPEQRLTPDRMPGTLDQYRLRFHVERRVSQRSPSPLVVGSGTR